jgi:hypothetical protein
VTTTTGNGVWTVTAAGYGQIRVRFSSFMSGTAIVSLIAVQAKAGPAGGGGGGGTVSSIATTSPITGGTITTTGTIACATCVTGAAGSTTQVQFNNGGAFGGAAGLLYNSGAGSLAFAANLPMATNPVTFAGGMDLFSDAALVIDSADNFVPVRLLHGIHFEGPADKSFGVVMDDVPIVNTDGGTWALTAGPSTGTGAGGTITVSAGYADGGNGAKVQVGGGTAAAKGSLLLQSGDGSAHSIEIGPTLITVSGATTFGTSISIGGTLLISSTAPTVSSGFGTSPAILSSNGTATFRVNVGTGGTATSGVIGLPAAATGWNCFVDDMTTLNVNTHQTASTTTTVTVTTTVTPWTASDTLVFNCMAF